MTALRSGDGDGPRSKSLLVGQLVVPVAHL